jgi:protease-4
MLKSDNILALIYLKNKVHKWRSLAIISIFLAFLFLIKGLIGDISVSNVVGGDHIASIKIEGVIFEDEYRSEILEKILNDSSVKALIINIDSPGGGIVGSEILFNELRKISTNKPTVVLMSSLAASGGYMAAIASDYLIARNGTLTGSIGVLMQSAEITELANKIGVKFNTYKSSVLKGSPSPFEKANPLVDKAIKDSIADSYHFFTELVLQRRGEKLNKKMIDQIFDGRVFTGRQALEAGLIDEIGGKEEVLKYLAEKHKIDIESLPIKQVSLEKSDDKIINRLVGFLPFFNKEKSSFQNKIMAIFEI